MFKQTSNGYDHRFSLYHQDGLLDIFIGFGIALAGLFLWTGTVWMAAIFIPVFLPTFQTARRRFLQPRIGNLEFGPQLQEQSQKALSSVTLLFVGLLLAGTGMFFAFGLMVGPVNDFLRQYFLLVIAIIFTSTWIAAAAILKLNRFYLYAAFTFAALSAAQFTALAFWVALTILGGLIGFVGLLTVIRFVQQHPKAE